MSVRRLSLSAALASLLLVSVVPAASAECFPGNLPVKAGEFLAVGDAFLATVTEASNDVDPNPNGSDYDWHVELAVEATFVGNVPDAMSFNGFDSTISCAEFNGDALTTGERIIIAVEDLRPRYQPGAPFEGNIVVWRQTDQGWAFYEDAVPLGSDPAFHPPEARAASTKSEIIRFISRHALPSTSTIDGSATSSRTPGMALIWIAFAAGLALGLVRFGRRVTLPNAD